MTQFLIDHLGHRGDGVAMTDAGPVFIPGALAGETVEAKVDGDRAANVRIVTPSKDRVPPICRHFAVCGGCSVQHLRKEAYDGWKQALVSKALSDRGIEHPVEPLVSGDPGTRRRAVFSASRAGRSVALGYHEMASHKLVHVSECPVLVGEIVRALPDLNRLAGELVPKKGELRLTVLATTAGLDVTVEKADKSYYKKIPAVSRLAAEANWARLSVNGETLIEIRPPLLDMGGAALVSAPGGFTQATLEGEQALVDLVVKGVGKAKTVADLFSGAGTFALHLARQAKVHAVEGDAAALKALDASIRRAQGLKTLKTTRRDLFRSPLVREELANFEAVVFDPPRAGAQAQAAQLAGSDVKTVVAVSCNPATLARDLRILIDGGYALQTVTPVDQFVFSPHIEVVAVLHRNSAHGTGQNG